MILFECREALQLSAFFSYLFRVAKVKIRVRPVWMLLAVRKLKSRRQIESKIMPDALRADRAIPRRGDHHRLYISAPSGIVAIATAAATDSTADRTSGRVIFRRCTASAAADLHSLAHRQHLQNRCVFVFTSLKKAQDNYHYAKTSFIKLPILLIYAKCNDIIIVLLSIQIKKNDYIFKSIIIVERYCVLENRNNDVRFNKSWDIS